MDVFARERNNFTDARRVQLAYVDVSRLGPHDCSTAYFVCVIGRIVLIKIVVGM